MAESDRLSSNEITPENVYLNRRSLLKAGILAGSVTLTGMIYRRLNPAGREANANYNTLEKFTPADSTPENLARGFTLEEDRTPFQGITNYNNFYEFTTDKEAVSRVAQGFQSRPWSVQVDGLVSRPRVFDIDELLRDFPLEERVYRMRCVEAWSMVIPWVGIPLAHLLRKVEPLDNARYVAFESLQDPKRFPNQAWGVLNWPYVEGLRLDEAMHPLTLLAVGIYGRELLGQNGAPLRLVVPWKYGFKGIKSIVKITLVAKSPPSTWNVQSPSEYGFYANVNPTVPHPRWSQATEQRLGEQGRRPTLPFNGYGEQVAHLYEGMNLRKNF